VLALALWALADILIEYGEFERAAPLLAESAKVFPAWRHGIPMADTLGSWGRLAFLQGDIEKAHALLHQAVTLGRTLKHSWVLGEYQHILGLVTLYRGDVPEAGRLLADSLHLNLDLGNDWFLGRVCTYLAEMALWEGDLDAAEGWLAQSLPYRTDLLLSMIAQIERIQVAARLATAQGAWLRAATLFGLADEMRRRIHYELAGPARQLADAALGRVQAALDAGLFADAFTTGQRLSLEEALATITAPSSATGAPLPLPQPPP